MPRCSQLRLVALSAFSMVLIGCPGPEGNGGEDAGATVTDAGSGPECTRSRDCAADERCDENGECVARQTTCADDTDCPAGQRCENEACVADTRTPCTAHRDCVNGGEICKIEAQMNNGFCERITDSSCQEDSDCSFNAADGPTRGLCADGTCKGDQFFSCSIANDCGPDYDCTALGNRSMCLRPCVSNLECDSTLTCNPQLNACWYNLCGNGGENGELSPNFAEISNGRLGGACRADAPSAPEPTACVQDSDCANLGQSARCNTEFAQCEVICDGNNSVCGTNDDRGWTTCAANNEEVVRDQACGQGPACDEQNQCQTGAACDGNGMCSTGNACQVGADCGDGELCIEGFCRTAALCEDGNCVDPNLCQEGHCLIDDCPEGLSCLGGTCKDTCLDDSQCVNAGDRCTGQLDPAPMGEPCDDQNACAGGAECVNGRCPLPEGTETGECEPVTGICQYVAGDGHCVEVNAGANEWVGLCIAGGQIPLGGACTFGAERSAKDQLCGNGGQCAVASDDNPTMGTCHAGCSPEGSHGSVNCPEGTTCSPTGGYACLANEDLCDPAASESCGENTKCGFFGWEDDQAFCVGYDPDLPRAAYGEACENTAQCADGAVCLDLYGQGTQCIEMCRPGAPGEDGACGGGLNCRSLGSLSQGSIGGPFGLCVNG